MRAEYPLGGRMILEASDPMFPDHPDAVTLLEKGDLAIAKERKVGRFDLQKGTFTWTTELEEPVRFLVAGRQRVFAVGHSRLWRLDLMQGNVEGDFPIADGFTRGAAHPVGDQLFLYNKTKNSLTAIDTRTGRVLRSTELGETELLDLTWLGDGSALLAVYTDHVDFLNDDKNWSPLPFKSGSHSPFRLAAATYQPFVEVNPWHSREILFRRGQAIVRQDLEKDEFPIQIPAPDDLRKDPTVQAVYLSHDQALLSGASFLYLARMDGTLWGRWELPLGGPIRWYGTHRGLAITAFTLHGLVTWDRNRVREGLDTTTPLRNKQNCFELTLTADTLHALPMPVSALELLPPAEKEFSLEGPLGMAKVRLDTLGRLRGAEKVVRPFHEPTRPARVDVQARHLKYRIVLL